VRGPKQNRIAHVEGSRAREIAREEDRGRKRKKAEERGRKRKKEEHFLRRDTRELQHRARERLLTTFCFHSRARFEWSREINRRDISRLSSAREKLLSREPRNFSLLPPFIRSPLLFTSPCYKLFSRRSSCSYRRCTCYSCRSVAGGWWLVAGGWWAVDAGRSEAGAGGRSGRKGRSDVCLLGNRGDKSYWR
jgi:hypothetical protein